MRLNEKFTLHRLFLVAGLWLCLIFSMSRTGLIACLLMSVLILLAWPKRLIVGVIILAICTLLWLELPQSHTGDFIGMHWVPGLGPSGLDGSSFVRGSYSGSPQDLDSQSLLWGGFGAIRLCLGSVLSCYVYPTLR